MPYVRSQGLRRHYQVEGHGAPLVFQHGFGDSLESWYELGYVEAFKDEYRLILLDARGHGASDKPHEPAAYSFPNVTADVVAVLKEPLGFDDVLPTLSIPSLLMVGEADAAYARVTGCSRSIPNATFVPFPSLGHTGSFLNRAEVVSHMQQFLRGLGGG